MHCFHWEILYRRSCGAIVMKKCLKWKIQMGSVNYKVSFITIACPHDLLYKISHWKQCILGSASYLLLSHLYTYSIIIYIKSWLIFLKIVVDNIRDVSGKCEVAIYFVRVHTPVLQYRCTILYQYGSVYNLYYWVLTISTNFASFC